MFSQSRTTSSERGDFAVLGTAKLRHRKSILWPTTRGGDVSKRNKMEFTIVSNEIQFFVIRNSKLAGPRRSASQWINWHRKTTLTAYPLRNVRDIRKIGISHWTNRARMHRWDSDQTSEQQSQLWTVSTENQEKNDQNQFLLNNTKGGISLLLPALHGIKTGGAQFFFCCSRIVYSWWQSAATDGVCKQYTSYVTFFSCLSALMKNSHTTLAQCVSARPPIHVSCAWVFDLSSTLASHSSFLSPIFHFILLNFDLYLLLFHMDVAGARSLVHFAQCGVWSFGQQRTSHTQENYESQEVLAGAGIRRSETVVRNPRQIAILGVIMESIRSSPSDCREKGNARKDCSKLSAQPGWSDANGTSLKERATPESWNVPRISREVNVPRPLAERWCFTRWPQLTAECRRSCTEESRNMGMHDSHWVRGGSISWSDCHHRHG